MLTYVEQDRVMVIPQASHALVAWQIAERWGNRLTARPSPRAEVLAAVLLHDGGWADYDAAPSLDSHGRLRTFDRMDAGQHLAIWRACVAHAVLYCRYSALLVSAHVSALAERKADDLARAGDDEGQRQAREFAAEMADQQAQWRHALAEDRRYAHCLEGAGWEVNRRLLAAADAVSVHLCARLPRPFTVTACDRRRRSTEVRFESAGARVLRARPWPFEGGQVRVHCQGWQVERDVFASESELATVLQQAPMTRLGFTIARCSTAAEAVPG